MPRRSWVIPGMYETNMMTSSNGSIFRVTGHLCGEFTGHRWIPLTKLSDAELRCSLDLRLNKQLKKQSWGWWFETPSRLSWRHCNVIVAYSRHMGAWFWVNIRQVMCLTAPSHYIKRCSLIINRILWHSLRPISQKLLKISNEFKHYTWN